MRQSQSIQQHPWFGSGFGARVNSSDDDVAIGEFSTVSAATREHGNSYLAILEGVGLLGVLPFAALIIMFAVKLGGVFAWLRRTGNFRHYVVPVTMVLTAGLIHAGFEDWLFAVGYYLSVFFWVLAFSFLDLLPAAAPAARLSAHHRLRLCDSGTKPKHRCQRAMMHLFLNGLAASAGGGLTYLRNVLPHLSTRQGRAGDCRREPAVAAGARRFCPGSHFLRSIFPRERCSVSGRSRRRWQRRSGKVERMCCFPSAILRCVSLRCRRSCFHVTRSTPRQIFCGMSAGAAEYGLWLETRIKGSLARRSIVWADSTVAPTEAFAQELRQWTGRNVVAIHHGFDPEAFFRDETPLAADIRQKLELDKDALRLLYVSHYNYYRNFETLLRALPGLRERLGGRKLRLFLTCRLRSEDNPGSYRAQAAADLVAQLGIGDMVVELGAVPYSLLHQVYRACSIYVAPAYAESFAHPLVEAMASGLPVVAADSAVHREICQDAALYFPRFSPEALGARVCQIADSAELSKALSDRGRERSRAFSWHKHVDELLDLAANLLATIDPVRRRSDRAS